MARTLPTTFKGFLHLIMPLAKYLSKYVKTGDTVKIMQPKLVPAGEGMAYKDVEICSINSYDSEIAVSLGKLFNVTVIEGHLEKDISESNEVTHTTHVLYMAVLPED